MLTSQKGREPLASYTVTIGESLTLKCEIVQELDGTALIKTENGTIVLVCSNQVKKETAVSDYGSL